MHLSRDQDAERCRENYGRGHAPDETPYGFHLAEQMGFSVSYSRHKSGALGQLAGKICRGFLGLDLPHAFANRRAMADADIVWTMLEVEALGASALMELGIIPPCPIVGSTVWVIDRWSGLSRMRRWLVRRLSRRFSALTVHTAPCLERARQVLPEVEARLLHFGVSSVTFSPRRETPESEPIHIVAVGNDRTRDWGVVLEAFGNRPGIKLTILCQWFSEREAARYSNVSAPRRPDMATMLALYRQATYLAVPMHENIFSGITVAIEAAAMEIPLLSTRTGGVPTYFGEDQVLYLPVGDSEAWRSAVKNQSGEERKAMAERARRQFETADYSTRGMIGRYADLTDEILGKNSRGLDRT